MLKNYFKTAFRNLKKNKSYAFISISGLAIGLAVCILLLLYVQNELSYDSYHEKADNIYRLTQPEHPFHAPQVAQVLANNLPEIKDYVRILPRYNEIVQYKEKLFKENSIAYVDPSFFKMFSFRFDSGDKETALDQPFTVVISEEIARKYFGHEDPIGKVFKVNKEFDYTITGIMEEMPQNSHFRYEIIFTLSSAERVYGEWMNNWGWQNFHLYFRLQEKFSKNAFESKCSKLLKNPYDPKSPLPKYELQNIKDIHLYSSHFKNDIQPQNSITYVLIFSAIGILILLIACFNYINLLTANATTRMKEVGIKKVVGATRNQLAIQFMGESFLVLFISMIISLLIVQLSLPIFSELSGKVLFFTSLLQVKNILGIFGIVCLVSILAGFYPSFFLSSIQPIKTLKSSINTDRSKLNFRKLLVGAQFIVVIVLICSALFMYSQIKYLQNKELGIDKEYVLVSELNSSFDNVDKYNSLKEALLKESVVTSVSSGSRVPSNTTTNITSLKLEGQTENTKLPIIHVNQDYFETLGITVLKGRLFSTELATDVDEALILNETAVKELGIQGNPIGQSIKCGWPKSDRIIVGVINDIHFESLYEPIRPTAFVIDYSECFQLMIKVNPSNAENATNKLKAICSSFYPDEVFEFHFLDDKLEHLYQTDKNTFKLMGYFTTLAILISCMGLFGLALFIMKSRTKEIGVRKVLGASIPRILIMLVKDFTNWVIIANIIAWPITYYVITKWLENFAYRIDVNFWLFLLGGIIAFLIALGTVGFQAIKSATANPIDSLKNE